MIGVIFSRTKTACIYALWLMGQDVPVSYTYKIY